MLELDVEASIRSAAHSDVAKKCKEA